MNAHEKKLQERLFTSMGEASTCWKNLGGAEFDSTRCQQVAQSLFEFILDNTVKRPATLREKLLFFGGNLIRLFLLDAILNLVTAGVLWCACLAVYPINYWTAYGIIWILSVIKVQTNNKPKHEDRNSRK